MDTMFVVFGIPFVPIKNDDVDPEPIGFTE